MNNNKGTYGSPLTPPFKYGQGVRGGSMSPTQIILLFFQIISTISLKVMN